MLEAAAFFAFGLFALTYIWWRSISGYRLETAAVNQFDDVSHHENDESAQEECVRVNEVLPTSESGKVSSPLILKIYYATQTNTARLFAERIAVSVLSRVPKERVVKAVVQNISDLDVDSVLPSTAGETQPADGGSENALHLFVMATYTDGLPTESAKAFCQWLEDTRFDFRISKTALARMRFGVFGLGHSEYGRRRHFNSVAKEVDGNFAGLGAQRVMPLALGDQAEDMEQQLEEWVDLLVTRCCTGEILEQVTDAVMKGEKWGGKELPATPADSEYSESEEEEDEAEIETANRSDAGDAMMDVEDLGKVAAKLQTAVAERRADVQRAASRSSKRTIGEVVEGDMAPPPEPKAMVTPMLEKSLTKQGYKIIGTHSGVKICRWTKSMMRGRGGCYKHTFYGIASHQCMETTPSLACANKCVFCWRHHTNPVGTEWRWKMEEPETIVDGAMEQHYKMIRSFKGVPGVKPERFAEALDIQHCALSLVGEPIMYPKINEFVDLLHERKISSFLVTNAQFPDKILELKPVTQLYVSVDAATKDSLKKVDRPLFQDFWERFLDCLDALATKGQRTVYRLTLVKEFNTEELQDYARLINRGRPDFIEVKGVTYCGYGGANPLTMSNVPFQHEVIRFVAELTALLDEDYEIACEHAHSCSILVANKRKFKRDGQWWTWIDYGRFHELIASGEPFTSLDYMARTPEWAVYGAEEKGFDPNETRVFRKKLQQS